MIERHPGRENPNYAVTVEVYVDASSEETAIELVSNVLVDDSRTGDFEIIDVEKIVYPTD